MSKPVNAVQPLIVTNYLAGTVSLRILIGAEEQAFQFQTTRWRDAGMANADVAHNPTAVLSEEVARFLRALGYEPIVEHKT